jgi:hypothetical protein
MREYPGAQACFLSHLAIWDRIAADGLDWAVIFEDGIVFHPRWRELAPAFWAETSRDLDLLYLGGNILNPSDDELVVRCPTWAMQAYIVTRKGIVRLRQALQPTPEGMRAIDMMLVAHPWQGWRA